MKTNKSFKKRLKLTKNGKIVARSKGQNHYNAKESGNTTISKRRKKNIEMSTKSQSRFLVNISTKY